MEDAPQHFNACSKFKNIIVFADENIDYEHEFAAWGDELTLNYSDDEPSIDVERSKEQRNRYDTFCRNLIMLNQPKFAIVVHDQYRNVQST